VTLGGWLDASAEASSPEASSPEASSPEASSPEASSPEASSPEASSHPCRVNTGVQAAANNLKRRDRFASAARSSPEADRLILCSLPLLSTLSPSMLPNPQPQHPPSSPLAPTTRSPAENPLPVPPPQQILSTPASVGGGAAGEEEARATSKVRATSKARACC